MGTLDIDSVLNGTASEDDVADYTSEFYKKYISESDLVDNNDSDVLPDKLGLSGIKFTPEDLLNWIKRQTSDYDNVSVDDFTNSFKDGLALSALLHAMDPTSIDFKSLNSTNAKENVENALNIAKNKFGLAKLVSVDDVVNGNASKDDMVACTSQFFQKYLEDSDVFGNAASRDLGVEGSHVIHSDLERQKLLDDLQNRKDALLAEIAGLQDKIKDEISLRKKMAEEIQFLKQQASSDGQLRSVLEQKVKMLESLVDGGNNTIAELSQTQKQLAEELERQRRRGEEMSSGLNNLESERSNLLTDAETKANALRELEERRDQLLNEIADLHRRIKEEMERRQQQAKEIAFLKNSMEHMSQKQIVQSKARVGLDALKKNLEDHLEDLYQWRDLHDIDMKEPVEDFDLSSILSNLNSKNFEDQLSYLDGRLQEENRNLCRIIQLKDDKAYLDEVILKSGWLVMKGHKEWKKRWFTLAGNRFSFYEDETSEDVA